jgi:hypothetical protein
MVSVLGWSSAYNPHEGLVERCVGFVSCPVSDLDQFFVAVAKQFQGKSRGDAECGPVYQACDNPD